MYLSRKQKDVKRIDDLTLLCRGKIGAGALIAGRRSASISLQKATEMAKMDPGEVNRVLQTAALDYRWVAESLDEIRSLLSGINFENVAQVIASKGETKPMFEDYIVKVINRVNDTYGVLIPAKKILKNETETEKPKGPVIKLAGEIRDAAEEMDRLGRRVLQSWKYALTDARIICGLLAIAIVAAPTWYFYGPHHAAMAGTPAPVTINLDRSEFLRVIHESDLSWWERLFEGIRFIFKVVLDLPALFIAFAMILTIVRQRVFPHPTLRKVEQTLYQAGGKALSQASNPTTGPKFSIKFNTKYVNQGDGPQNSNTGDGIQFNK